jgi:hypothetical protein
VQNIQLHSALPTRLLIVSGVLVWGAFYAHSLAKPGAVFWALVAILFFSALGVLQVARQPAHIGLDPKSDSISISYRKWSGKRTKFLRLSDFRLIRSYSAGANLPVTIVELATEEELPRAIRLATYDERFSPEKRFFAIPRFLEAPAAAALRSRLAQSGHFRDEGYLGDFNERRAEDVW